MDGIKDFLSRLLKDFETEISDKVNEDSALSYDNLMDLMGGKMASLIVSLPEEHRQSGSRIAYISSLYTMLKTKEKEDLIYKEKLADVFRDQVLDLIK